VLGSFDHGKEHSGTTKYLTVLEQISDRPPLNKGSVPKLVSTCSIVASLLLTRTYKPGRSD
jgi:hypothetical protein